MRNKLLKKYSVLFVMWVYAVSTFLQSFSFLNFNKVYAQESQLDYTNLVAIFVDKKIYWSLESNIEWYAKTYIQWANSNYRHNAISNSRSIVLPVDIDNITAPEITKILENMYFDWVSWEPSKLVWVILIWDIPLPVVNQDGFIYPTIYPYVDFEKQKFIWNDDIKYFVYNNKPKWQAEIRHGLINFDTIDEYRAYFNKLKNYAQNPSDFVEKSIWYEDLIANKKYFFSDGLWAYINNFLFAEDIGQKRYTDLMVKIMQWTYNDAVKDIAEGMNFSWQEIMNSLQYTNNDMNTPTKFIDTMVKEWYLRPYTSLFGIKHLDRIAKNVETANRRIEQVTWSDWNVISRTALDTSYYAISQKDESLLQLDWKIDPLIVSFNNALEKIVDEKIEKEKYRLNEIIPLTYLKYAWIHKTKCKWKTYDAYENYFFGMPAKYIDNMQQVSTYRWTYRNFDDIIWLKTSHIQAGAVPSSDVTTIDLNKKSVWWSYDIFATQVDANRWYNINNTIKELEIYENNKVAKREHRSTKCEKRALWICWKKRKWQASTQAWKECELSGEDYEQKQWWCESPQEFAIRNRWWASPLNLSWTNQWKSGYIFQNAILPIFDIAGSTKLAQAQNQANSFLWVNTYSRLIQRTFVAPEEKFYFKNKAKEKPDLYGFGYNSNMWEDVKFTNQLPTGDLDADVLNWVPSNPKLASNVNFFTWFNNGNYKSWEWDIFKIKKEENPNDECKGNGTILTYKTLDSRVKNVASTNTDLYGTVYKIFEDDISPSKRFYETLSGMLNSTYKSVSDVTSGASTTSVVYKMEQLRTYIKNITGNVNNIYTTGLSANWTSGYIQNLATQRDALIPSTIYSDVENMVTNIQDDFVELYRLIDEFWYDHILSYMLEQIYNFNINWDELILQESWKNGLTWIMENTKNQYLTINNLINNSHSIYDDIEELKKNNLKNKLEHTKDAIEEAGWGAWCDTNNKFKPLCNTIDTLIERIDNYAVSINNKIEKIKKFDAILDETAVSFKPFEDIVVSGGSIIVDSFIMSTVIAWIQSSNDSNLTWYIPWMTNVTADRPIDSPKYITFKWIWWDKVTFIYPNLYKAEIFKWEWNALELKSPQEIKVAIEHYLRETVKKYNEYLINQNNKKQSFYNQHNLAYNALWEKDKLATPMSAGSDRPYNLMNENYLIDQLRNIINDNINFKEHMWEYEPIEFIAHLIYYQNIWRQQRKVWNTILKDMNNIVEDFDVNEKIRDSLESYLVKDNNQWSFVSPAYRNKGYEVAFINSNGEDLITEKATLASSYVVNNIQNSANNFSNEAVPEESTESMLLENLSNVCWIPDNWWVLLFDISGSGRITTPWFDALKCRWEQTKKLFRNWDFISIQRPITLQNIINSWVSRNTIQEDFSNNLDIGGAISQMANQNQYLNNDESNQAVLNNANNIDYSKLDKILSYTQIWADSTTITADEAGGAIDISSTVELNDVDFHIKNIWSSTIRIKDGDTVISHNITEETGWFSTGKVTFDPFYKKKLSFEIQNPVDWRNVVVFYMCLPWTQNLQKCVTKTLTLEVVPWKIHNLEILTQWDSALQWSKFPIIVKWTDKFGNNVWQIFDWTFEISTSSGTLSHEASQWKKIRFSNFNKSKFILNVDENASHNSQINIDVQWTVAWLSWWMQVSKTITVKKWQIKVYKWENAITSMTVNLPFTNEYSYKDSYNLTQINSNTIPKIKIKLQNTEWQNINIENLVSVSSKNRLLKPWEIETRNVTVTQNNNTFDVTQKRFAQTNEFVIKNWELEVYFMPSLKAWEDVISISISGIKTVNIPVTINPAKANIVEIKTQKDVIHVNSNLQANLKVFDNRGNVVNGNTPIKLTALWPLSVSGMNWASQVINITNGQFDFIIKSQEQWWYGFISAQIMSWWAELGWQKPGTKDIVVQDKIWPEENLNIMYLNLFGNDRWNQRGFMSDNNKYVQKLINSSEKLITTTTQLISPDNIKMFSTVMSKKIEFTNMDNKEIHFELDNSFKFKIKDVWEINLTINNLNFQEIGVSEENLENIITTMVNNKFANKNALIYIPEATDSIIESNEIKNNSILINNETVFDLSDKNQNLNLTTSLSNEYIAGYQTWEIKLGNKKIGTFLFVINRINDLTLQLQSYNSEYDYGKIWIDWSTNKEWVWFFKNKSSFPKTSLWYKSIQDSHDPTLWIWFTSDFKNITNFGAGKSVGEATVSFSSEFLINIWDPLLRRVDKNKNATVLSDSDDEIDSWFDKWIWEPIFSNPDKTILKVINIDFNNDWLEDIIVAFTDGSIKILKNYWWTTPFKDLWDLMVLADWIKEIIVWDVDGNWYKDIIIKNNSNVLRVYKNDRWVFDVDWLPICINTNVKQNIKSENPQNISWVRQIFFEDMNGDGILDIITSDNLWFIKIFYGGKTNWKDNFVSTNKFMCDDERYSRQQNNTNMVYRFGIRINENIKVLDQSLIHWKWLVPTNENNATINAEDLGVNPNSFSDDQLDAIFNEDNNKVDTGAINEMVSAWTQFDTNSAEEIYKWINRFKLANFWTIPYYENNIENEWDIPYVEIGCLTGEDPVKVYKKYEDINWDVLENWDKVQVTVVLKANENFTWTFIDKITGPWIVPLTGNIDMVEYFWFETGTISEQKIENELKFHRDMNNSRYMIDNLSMDAGDEIKIHYWIFYDGDTEIQTIELKDVDWNEYKKFWGNEGETINRPKDGLKDIKVVPTDGCNKSLFILFNTNQWNKKTYSLEYVDLAKMLKDLSSNAEENFENAMSEISNALTNGSDWNNVDLENVPGASKAFNWNAVVDIWSDNFSWSKIVSEWGVDLDNILNAPAAFLDWLAGDVMKKVDKAVAWACNGLKLSDLGIGDGTNCGLPVPFNQAFLWPGEYHLFGCFKKPLLPLSQTLWKWLPTLTVPGNRPSPAGYLPIPWIFGFPFKGPKDGFLWIPWGTNSSLFRLYLIPTLTAEIWIAMCFGPYNALKLTLPDPLGETAWNCLVMAVPLPCKEKWEEEAGQPDVTERVPETLTDMWVCEAQNIPCYIWAWEWRSSLELVSSSNNSYNMNSAVPEGSYAGWTINIETTPVTEYWYRVESANIEVEWIRLSGWADSQNKILWGNAKWCVKETFTTRLAAQTDYVMNNLTNFKIDVTLPDFEWMKADALAIVSSGTYQLTNEQKCANKWMKRNKETEICEKQKSENQNENLWKLSKRTQENRISRENITDLSETIPNPFVALEQMFKDIDLINIQTENVTVKVPMITSDDIVAYINMAQERLKKQEKVLKQRFDLFKSLIWLCGWEDKKENIKNRSDLKHAIKETKEQLKTQMNDELVSTEKQISELEQQIENTDDPEEKERLENKKRELEAKKDELKQDVETISQQITQIKKLNKKYNLNDLGNYEVFESCTPWEFFIKSESTDDYDQILPYDIYISYKPGENKELSMFTKWFKLVQVEEKKTVSKKIRVSIEKDWKDISNEGLCLKYKNIASSNQCVELFLWGKLDGLLNSFFNIQSNTQLLIGTIKQNIETLSLYKTFPTQLYKRIHVGERYMSDIWSLVNGVLGTLSLWMKTNATRYSQYVDAIILLLTTIETYQAIIDISKNWSEKCGTCTNDDYDQYNCKLNVLCNFGGSSAIPVIEIPPFKIPSILLDFSRLNLWIDVTLPKFNFVPISVPLPKLPNLPEPPTFDVSVDMEESLSLGIDLIGQLMEEIGLSLSPSIPAVPIIPAPPKLPEIPSVIPTVRLELPVLPPAPKIPKLPNEIKSIINTAETISRILCIIKKPIGFVKESSIKAKVEQITQRTYEVPYWDNFDKTFDERNKQSNEIPQWAKNAIWSGVQFLMANEFQNVQLKGFDIWIESFVNIQFKLDWVYDIIKSLVEVANSYSAIPGQRLQKEVIDDVDERSRETERRMSACVTKPASEECLGELYTGALKENKEKLDLLVNRIKEAWNNIKNGFVETKKAILLLDQYNNDKESLEAKIEETEADIQYITEQIAALNWDLEITTKEDRIRQLKKEISKYQDLLKTETNKFEKQQNDLEKLDDKIDTLEGKFRPQIDAYEQYLDTYGALEEEYQAIRSGFSAELSGALETINDIIQSWQQVLDYLHFEEVDERNSKIEADLQKAQEKQKTLKEQRYEDVGNLYKQINPGDEISYVDYDKNVYDSGIKNLKEWLNLILTKSDDVSLNKKVKAYIDIIDTTQQWEITPITDKKIENLKQQYYSVVNEFQKSNTALSELIEKDYDKFLYAVANNDISLVNNTQDINVTLSTKLFEASPNYMERAASLIDIYNTEHNTTEAHTISSEWIKSDSNRNEYSTKNKVLLSQNTSSSNAWTNNNGWSSTIDIAQYINVIKTPEWNINLANQDYVTDFQDRSIMADLNWDGKNDLILWNDNNIYVKYRDWNRNYDNWVYYKKYYKYNINSYAELFDNWEDWFIKIDNIYLKMYDENWEVKNFEYNGWSFDDIKISWLNSKNIWDDVDWYLIRMIHRADLFNDKEKIVTNNNQDFFDKKYMLAVPNGTSISGLRIWLEDWIFDIEELLTGVILDVLYYNESQNTIWLTITEIPRNRQYSQIYSLNIDDNLYYISNPSSNQIVWWPQIVSDEAWPEVSLNVFRPSIQEYIEEWNNVDLYVSTNYTIRSDRIDEGWIKKLWIADKDWNIIKEKDNVNSTTWTLELNNLYFTWIWIKNYYFVWLDINGNTSSTQVTLNIKKPDIEITNMTKYWTEAFGISSPVTVNAELSHDVDEAYVQFLRNRNGVWEILTWTMGGILVDKYKLNPLQTTVTWWYYDFGDDIWLYLSNWDLAAKINPKNWKISIENGFENVVKTELDYSTRVPMIKVLDSQNSTIFAIKLNSESLIGLETSLETRELHGDNFWDFNNGKAIIYNDEVLLYISPKGQIYTEEMIYWDYGFDDNTESVIYSFKLSKLGANLWIIKIKPQNLLLE